jgi:hypothetical protein
MTNSLPPESLAEYLAMVLNDNEVGFIRAFDTGGETLLNKRIASIESYFRIEKTIARYLAPCHCIHKPNT